MIVSAFIFHKHKLLLIHHRKKDIWLPVAGHVEKNETYSKAIIREIKEETNLNVNKLKLFLQEAGLKEFIVNVKDISKMEIDRNEIIGHKWFNITELDNISAIVRKKAIDAFEKNY